MTGGLGYRIELWSEDGKSVERTVARTRTEALGRKLFEAAMADWPGRRVTLRRLERVLADSAEQFTVPNPGGEQHNGHKAN